MQNRKAIIMSLGMLLKVDTNPFIVSMIMKAKQENPDFEFTPELQIKAFQLAEQFNCGKIDPDQFAAEMLALLNIRAITANDFLRDWSEIIDINGLSNQIEFLKEQAATYQSLFYLTSDTNLSHLHKIAEKAKEQGLCLKQSTNPAMLEQFPLYTSCMQKVSRFKLIQHVFDEIQSKKINPMDSIILIYGNPENIKNPAHRSMAERELKAIDTWCKEHGILIVLHNTSMEETLQQVFGSESASLNMTRLTC